MKRKWKLILFILCLVIICGVLAYGILSYHDYYLLRNSACYCSESGVGLGGGTTPELSAYMRLEANPFARRIFIELERNGTSAAKAYAIVALKKLDPVYTEELAQKYKMSQETTTFISGCIASNVKLSELFDNNNCK